MFIRPSSRRGRLIAGQAAIVAVLIAIVYLTFLQNNDPSPPSGIDAPGPQAQTDDTRSDGNGDRNGPGDGGGNSGGDGGGSGGGTGSGSTSFAGPTTTPGTSPADNQYFDTLSLLKDQLGISAAVKPDRLRRR